MVTWAPFLFDVLTPFSFFVRIRKGKVVEHRLNNTNIPCSFFDRNSSKHEDSGLASQDPTAVRHQRLSELH